MDAVDIALIRALEEDVRMPVAELARRAGISESTAGRRLARLRESGGIQLVAFHRPLRGGSTQAILTISVEPSRVTDVADRLCATEETRYVAVATGIYDVVAEAMFDDNAHLNRFLQEVIYPLPGVRSTNTFVVLTTKKIWGEPALMGREPRILPPMSRP